jgi:predicted nuclease of predicted toxin-antitoxin system
VKVVADEDVDRRIIERLRHDGHDLLAISETSPRVTDDVVLDAANQERRLLITEDKGFGEMVVRQRGLSLGVILIRLGGLSPRAKADIVSTAIREHEAELPGSFTVISPGSVRIRPIER